MAQAGLTKGDAIEFGFTPEVITTLGVMSLPGVGPNTVRELGDPDNIQSLFVDEDLAAFTTRLRAAGSKFSPETALVSDWSSLRERVWRSGVPLAADLVSQGIKCITPSSALYPSRLHDLASRKPKWLFLKGNVSLLGARCVAVVGTRNPSVFGDHLTKVAVSACRELGRPVVSGLAQGIDTIAHEWSLQVGNPTISILGTGICVAYPARNAGLADVIVEEGGLLVSEYMPSQPPTRDSFVWRNRLQACLSETVVAAEWNRASGTAHTVRFANELGRRSVSLEIHGCQAQPEAGKGVHHFVLPTEYSAFSQLLSDGLEQRLENSSFSDESARLGADASFSLVGERAPDSPVDPDAQSSLF